MNDEFHEVRERATWNESDPNLKTQEGDRCPGPRPQGEWRGRTHRACPFRFQHSGCGRSPGGPPSTLGHWVHSCHVVIGRRQDAARQSRLRLWAGGHVLPTAAGSGRRSPHSRVSACPHRGRPRCTFGHHHGQIGRQASAARTAEVRRRRFLARSLRHCNDCDASQQRGGGLQRDGRGREWKTNANVGEWVGGLGWGGSFPSHLRVRACCATCSDGSNTIFFYPRSRRSKMKPFLCVPAPALQALINSAMYLCIYLYCTDCAIHNYRLRLARMIPFSLSSSLSSLPPPHAGLLAS